MNASRDTAPVAAADDAAEAIRALAGLFDQDEMAEAAIRRGDDLAAFRDQLLDALAAAREPIAWPFAYRLRKPVDVMGETVDHLELREPTTDEFLKFGMYDQAVTGQQMLDLIAALAGKTPALIRKLPGLDTLALTAKLAKVFRQAAF